LRLLCADLFGGFAVYDAEVDRLRSAYKHEPRAIHPPPPIEMLMELPRFEGGPAPAQTGYGAPKAKARKPGWV
jgi:hypothetical protein